MIDKKMIAGILRDPNLVSISEDDLENALGGPGSFLSSDTFGQIADFLDPPLIQASNFTYLGNFLAPVILGSNPSSCITLWRKSDGTQSLLWIGRNGDGPPIVETNVPALGSRAVVKRVYTAVEFFQGHLTWPTTGTHLWVEGLHMVGNRCFWFFGSSYDVGAVSGAGSFGFTDFNPDGTLSAYGPFQTTADRHMARNYMVRIPDAFSQQYLSGMKFAIGCGMPGSGSIGASWGPSLFGINPPDPTSDPTKVISATPLFDYPTGHEMQRDSNYTPFVSHDRPLGYGGPQPPNRWQTTDHANSCAWIDLPNRYGILTMGDLGHGLIWYGDSPFYEKDSLGNLILDANGNPILIAFDPSGTAKGQHAEHYSVELCVYEPADLVAVIAGQKKPWEILPRNRIDMSTIIPNLNADKGGQSYIAAMEFIPEIRTLLVSARMAERYDQFTRLPIIHVIQIN